MAIDLTHLVFGDATPKPFKGTDFLHGGLVFVYLSVVTSPCSLTFRRRVCLVASSFAGGLATGSSYGITEGTQGCSSGLELTTTEFLMTAGSLFSRGGAGRRGGGGSAATRHENVRPAITVYKCRIGHRSRVVRPGYGLVEGTNPTTARLAGVIRTAVALPCRAPCGLHRGAPASSPMPNRCLASRAS